MCSRVGHVNGPGAALFQVGPQGYLTSNRRRDIVSIDSYDEKYPERERPDDRTLGEKIGDAARGAGDKLKEGWDELTDDERLSGDDVPDGHLHTGRDHDLEPEIVEQSGEGYGRHDTNRGEDVVDVAGNRVIQFDNRT